MSSPSKEERDIERQEQGQPSCTCGMPCCAERQEEWYWRRDEWLEWADALDWVDELD